MLRTVIIEDNPLSREALKADLARHPEIELVGEAEGVVSGLKMLNRVHPDLIFLDIELKDGNGFDILELAGRSQTTVIFVTASDRHAVKAFRFAAVDYLLKPVDSQLLSNAIEKAKLQLPGKDHQIRMLRNVWHRDSPEEIVLHTQEKIVVARIGDIIRCEAMNNYTKFYFDGGEQLLVTRTLKEFDKMLTGEQFIRTHQSHLVNKKWIKEFIKKEGGYIVMKDDSSVPVSYRKRKSVISKLHNK